MTTEEVEALAKLYEDAVAEFDPGTLGSVKHHAGIEAVARAVRARDAARGGTLTPSDFEKACTLCAEKGAGLAAAHLRAHSLEQGRTIAALEAAYAGLERTINADTDGKLALRKAHGARDDETYPEFVARLALERDEARAALATLRQAVAKIRKPVGHDGDEESGQCDEDCDLCLWEALQAMAEAFATPSERPDTATLRDLLALIHGDGGHHENAVGRAQAVEDAAKVLHALREDSATLRAIRERAKDAETIAAALCARLLETKWNDAGSTTQDDARRAAESVAAYLLGDSGPSGGGETRCRAGACHGGWRKPATRECGYCDDCCGHARGICAKPTTPPNVVTKWTRLADHPAGCECTECYTSGPKTAEHGWRTNPLGTTAFFLCGLRSCKTCEPYRTGTPPTTPPAVAESKPKPTPEEDWRALSLLLREIQASEHFHSALDRLKAEPRRAAEAMRERCADAAPSIADAIMHDLSDRKFMLDGIAGEVLEEIRDAMTEIVRSRLRALSL